MALRLSALSRSAAADGVVDRLDAGAGPATIQIRTGAQPSTPEDAATGTLLATFTLNDPAFASASAGVAALNVGTAITATGVAAGTAGWGRAFDSDGNVVLDGGCATSGDVFNMDTTTVSVGLTLHLVSGSYTQPRG
jgi:hypothetical protein